MRTKELAAFIKAREFARETKEAVGSGEVARIKRLGRQDVDPIIARYRFCNVRRNDDRVTKWIHTNWLHPHANDPYLWFAMVVARLFNLPFTLNAIGYPVPFRPAAMRLKLHMMKAHGNNIFNAAYIVSTNGRAMDKVDYLFDYVLAPMWASRKEITKALEDVPLAVVWDILQQQNGLGSFMAAQVVADLKYAPPWQGAPDWYTFAAPGPGSKRGLNRVMGNATDANWPGRSWQTTLDTLRKAILPLLPQYLGSHLHAQDLQNCLCEFDKYERVRLGEGRPKQFYKPYKGVL